MHKIKSQIAPIFSHRMFQKFIHDYLQISPQVINYSVPLNKRNLFIMFQYMVILY